MTGVSWLSLSEVLGCPGFPLSKVLFCSGFNEPAFVRRYRGVLSLVSPFLEVPVLGRPDFCESLFGAIGVSWL